MFRGFLHGAFAGVVLCAAATAQAGPVTLNLKDADIGTLVQAVSEITGRNFIVDPRIKARVTVISSRPMDERDVYAVFLSVLAVHGFAAIPGDKVVKIVPEADAKQETVPTVEDGRRGVEADQIVTRVIQVRNTAAAQLVPLIRPLIPAQGHLAALPGPNMLVISDKAANVERVGELIARFDQAAREDTEVVTLQNATAADLLPVIAQLEAKTGEGGMTPVRVLADERTNSLILKGEQLARARLRQLIERLDAPVAGRGKTQVVFLRYAQAKTLATALQGLAKQLAGAARSAEPAGGGGGAVSIEAEENSNALLLTAPPTALRSLLEVIAQLDVRRAQVLVEAIVAEISLERSAKLGVQWLIGDRQGETVVGIVNFDNLLNTLAGAVAAREIPQSLASGAHVAVSAGVGSLRFAALISALSSDGNTNVLSTPSLVTLDNQEAEIIVGQNVPFVTGTFTTSVGGSLGAGTGLGSGSSGAALGLVGNPFQTIQRQDVGLQLKVKPQINENSAIRLDISQEVSSLASVSPSQGPTTNKRSIKTSVMIEDGQLLVLGGLIDDSVNDAEDKVPVLGDVPVLGGLFRYRNQKKVKRNLMIFLRPVILRDGVAATAGRYAAIRGVQQQAAAVSDTPSAVLPPFDEPYPGASLALGIGRRLSFFGDTTVFGWDDPAVRAFDASLER